MGISVIQLQQFGTLGTLCGYGSITDVLWALQCVPKNGKKKRRQL
jgi:hypothetical protein